jgi:glycerol kinase
MSEFLLGIDEGTSAVKAVVYDTELRPIAEARQEKRLHHPRPGWVEQDGEEVLTAVTRAVADVLQLARERDSSAEIAAAGLDHQGESVLAWDAERGEALTPIVTWQDKRSQEVLDQLETDGRAEVVRERSGMPLDPYFSAGKLAWLLEHDSAVAAARNTGTLRLGTVDSWICDRLGAGFATDPSTASRTQLGAPEWDDELLAVFGVPRDSLPAIEDTAGELGTLRHDSWPVDLPLRARCVDQQAALAGAGCVVPGRVKATYGTGVFVLAHAEDSNGVRVLPALAGVGAPWWRPDARGVIAGLTSGTRPAHVARAAFEAIAWRVADITATVAEAIDLDVLRVDGGLTRSANLLQLQADAAGVPVQTTAVDATAAGAAALAAVGAGIWPSTEAIADHIPVGERTEPARDDEWRRREHAAWREFVESATKL